MFFNIFITAINKLKKYYSLNNDGNITMKQTIFCCNDLDLYFLDFLSLDQMKNYPILSKASYDLFQKSCYHKELNLYLLKYNYVKFNKICEFGYLNLLKAYLRNDVKKDYNMAFPAAIEYGHLDLVKYLISQNNVTKINENSLFEEAIKNNQISIAKYILSLYTDVKIDINHALWFAVSYGRFDMVKYLVSIGADVRYNNYWAIEEAVSDGHIEILKYLVSLAPGIKINNMLFEAISNGHLDVVKYIVSLGISINEINCGFRWSVNSGYVDIYYYFISMGAPV